MWKETSSAFWFLSRFVTMLHWHFWQKGQLALSLQRQVAIIQITIHLARTEFLAAERTSRFYPTPKNQQTGHAHWKQTIAWKVILLHCMCVWEENQPHWNHEHPLIKIAKLTQNPFAPGFPSFLVTLSFISQFSLSSAAVKPWPIIRASLPNPIFLSST